MNMLLFFEKGFWLGIVALGFALLFNVPKRTLFFIGCLGFIGGVTKLALINHEFGIILATFIAASLIGVLSHIAGWLKSTPPIVFSIPASIPLVPGIYVYRMMLGFISLGRLKINSDYSNILNDTVHNGMIALFSLISLAVGAALPLLIVRKKSSKELKELLSHKKE